MVGILLLASFFHAAESQNLDLLRQIMYLTSAGFFAHEQLFFTTPVDLACCSHITWTMTSNDL